MSEPSKSFFSALVDRIFPKTPDFFKLLTEQCQQVSNSVDDLVEFMKTGNEELGKKSSRMSTKPTSSKCATSTP